MWEATLLDSMIWLKRASTAVPVWMLVEAVTGPSASTTGGATDGSAAASALTPSAPTTPCAVTLRVTLRTVWGRVHVTSASPSGLVRRSTTVPPAIRPCAVSASANLAITPACGCPKLSVTWTRTGRGSTVPGAAICPPPAMSARPAASLRL